MIHSIVHFVIFVIYLLIMSDRLSKAIQILKNLNQPDRIVKRDNINFIKIMDVLGHPYNSFKSIHITGTNGKGSVALKTAKILQSAGYKAGLYTSPHLFTFRQRIQVNGEIISRQQISDNIIKIYQLSEKHNIPLSYFEFITASGFMHFQAKGCDYVSLQVGVGGTNDTTNIVTPQISVITSIGLDHVELLGPTEENIAKEKSGIIKKERPVILGPMAQEYKGIQEAIQKNHCQVYKVSKFEYNHKDFESENNATVRKCIEALADCNPNLKVKESNIRQGLMAKQPCRMEKLKEAYLPHGCKDKQIYFDVGHNPPAIKKIKQSVQNQGFKKEQVAFVFGTSKRKKFDEALSQIQEIADHIYLVEAKHQRACQIGVLQGYIGQAKYPRKFRCISNGDIHRTLQYATIDPTIKALVISGSFFIMPQARGFYEPHLVQHPQENLNQVYILNQRPII